MTYDEVVVWRQNQTQKQTRKDSYLRSTSPFAPTPGAAAAVRFSRPVTARGRRCDDPFGRRKTRNPVFYVDGYRTKILKNLNAT
jgi:hypothetical protein